VGTPHKCQLNIGRHKRREGGAVSKRVERSALRAVVKSWRQDTSAPQILLLVGSPGSGKSTFCEGLAASDDPNIDAAHFCRGNDASSVTGVSFHVPDSQAQQSKQDGPRRKRLVTDLPTVARSVCASSRHDGSAAPPFLVGSQERRCIAIPDACACSKVCWRHTIGGWKPMLARVFVANYKTAVRMNRAFGSGWAR
jgi:hypothetical protein